MNSFMVTMLDEQIIVEGLPGGTIPLSDGDTLNITDGTIVVRVLVENPQVATQRMKDMVVTWDMEKDFYRDQND